MVVHTFNPNRQRQINLCEFQASQDHMVRPYLKNRTIPVTRTPAEAKNAYIVATSLALSHAIN